MKDYKDYSVLDSLVKDTQKLHREIFDKGYEQGGSIEVVRNLIKDVYDEGMNDAWNIARRLTGATANHLSEDQKIILFMTTDVSSIMQSHTAQEVKETIDMWEEKKKRKEYDDEFHVGDEVQGAHDKWVITSINATSSFACGITAKGEARGNFTVRLKKTGRHFISNLSNLLSMIGEE